MVLSFLKPLVGGGGKKAEPIAELPPGTKSSSSASKSALTVNEFVARTKRCREKGLEPTMPEKIAYARYLGIDPIVDKDLMWIADEALTAPLPSEWTEHHDSADRVFYYNVQTHASSWTHPLEQLHRDTYKAIVNFRNSDLNKEDRAAELDKLKRKCDESEREAHKELQAWSEHVDESGQKFYYNREHQRSVWTDPRPARCHALYLQMKALRVMSKQQAGAGGLGKPGQEPLPNLDRDDDIDKNGLLRDHGRHKDMFGDRSDTEGAKFHGFLDNRSESLDHLNGSAFDDEGDGRKRKKKKRRDEEASRKEESSVMPSPRQPLGNLESLPPGDMKKELLDLKKPSVGAVEEVRAAIGFTGGTRLPAMGRQPTHLLNGNYERLPSPPGDGLSTIGRTRVRAGIRLEPLQS